DRSVWFRADGEARHLSWARWADALLVAPASADALAAAASGRADDPVAALALAVPRTAYAPAMNAAMWDAPAVRRNVARLREDGHEVIVPAVGPLGTPGEGAGAGRLPDEGALVDAILRTPRPRDLLGRRVLVSAGPTREWLDPVRFLSNPSSGRMGFAVAEAARDRGAEVDLVHGPTSAPVPHGVAAVRIETAEEMLEGLTPRFEACDLLVMTAAVADWRPEERKREKEPKSGTSQQLRMVRTPDLLTELARTRREQVTVGFAMETDKGVERAAEKATRKGLAFVALNYPTRGDSAFGGDATRLTLVAPDGAAQALPRLRKREAAERLLDRAVGLLPER
ncbi:MAG: bifunctional phosphopantothenoylcysteine decarboxylase/phosphopantothenate--cysteine ligase CoaBC, partial [Trueperaceae bacterium]